MRFNVETNKYILKWESCKEQLQSTVTNFQCGNFESWKKDQIMIHILCLRHSYEKTYLLRFVMHKVLFSQVLEHLIIFNNSFLKVKGPSRSLLKRWEYQIILLVSWETCMQIKKQQLKPDMEQWTDSKLGKEYLKAVYCHPIYLTYMQSTSCEMPGLMNHKLESRLLGEISTTADI